MGIITRQEKINDKWFAWIVTEGFNTIMAEDDHEITEAEAEQKLLDWQASQIVVDPVIEEVIDGTTN